jgi:riboflavin synthase
MPALAPAVGLGDSVAVNGICLTAVAIERDEVAFEAMGETLARTALGTRGAGSPVNLEPALRADDRLGGHVVQGHVDGVGEVVDVRTDGIARVVRFRAPAAVVRYLVEKGSIAVDGVSLTVSALTEDGFEIWLIPHTCAVTTLGAVEVGDLVNLEVDVLAKYVERLVRPSRDATMPPAPDQGT